MFITYIDLHNMLDIYVHEYLRTFVFKQVTYFIRHSGGIKVWKIYLIRWTMLLRPLDFSTYRRAIFNSPEVKKKKSGIRRCIIQTYTLD